MASGGPPVRRGALSRLALGRASICHCRMCQKAFGGFGALVTVQISNGRGARRTLYQSSKVQRGLRAECGTPLEL